MASFISAVVSIQELRKQVASVLADVKAHELPGLCSRFGLSEGTQKEAFQGKFRYVHSRLLEIEAKQLIRVAHEVLAEFPNPALEELLAKYEETGRPLISEITRRRVIESLSGVPLEGRLGDLFELLDAVCPTESLPQAYPHWDPSQQKSLRDDIEQYCIRNYDWANAELLQHLGMLTCSQRRFFAYLERFVHPVVREEAEQAELVARLNTLLERDGYALQVSGRISGYPVYAVRPLTRRGVTPADQELSESFQADDGPLRRPGLHAAD